MPYFEYKIQVTEVAEREIAIALLSELGFDGFQENEAELIAITNIEIAKQEFEAVMEIIGATYYKSTIEEINWNAKWESDFQPIAVFAPDSDEVFAYVRAHFHAPPQQALHDLVITPKMSFGTGHHATTYGMMAYMSRMNFRGKSVVDFGTGTGVLAILAEKMGAAIVLAIDNDPWCIRNAEENVLVNDCKAIVLKQADYFKVEGNPDIILANINLNIIKANTASIKNACSEKSLMLFSGILAKDEAEIVDALQKVNMRVIEIINQDGWLIIATDLITPNVTLTPAS